MPPATRQRAPRRRAPSVRRRWRPGSMRPRQRRRRRDGGGANRTLGKAFAAVGPGGTAWLQNGRYTSADEGLTDIALFDGLALPTVPTESGERRQRHGRHRAPGAAKRQRRRPGVRCRPAGSRRRQGGTLALSRARTLRLTTTATPFPLQVGAAAGVFVELQHLGDLQLWRGGIHHVHGSPRGSGRAARHSGSAQQPHGPPQAVYLAGTGAASP